mmetsp:Transcript_21310/g.72168  ORF Transcript_21310/g.72168 Transcript_21310/m.72168 type:complete len:214 (-) Transcript_21310:1120-1761(-)
MLHRRRAGQAADAAPGSRARHPPARRRPRRRRRRRRRSGRRGTRPRRRRRRIRRIRGLCGIDAADRGGRGGHIAAPRPRRRGRARGAGGAGAGEEEARFLREAAAAGGGHCVAARAGTRDGIARARERTARSGQGPRGRASALHGPRRPFVASARVATALAQRRRAGPAPLPRGARLCDARRPQRFAFARRRQRGVFGCGGEPGTAPRVWSPR